MQMGDKSVALSQRDGVEGKQLLDLMFVEALHMICGWWRNDSDARRRRVIEQAVDVINLQAAFQESLVSLLKIFTQNSCWLEELKNCAGCSSF